MIKLNYILFVNMEKLVLLICLLFMTSSVFAVKLESFVARKRDSHGRRKKVAQDAKRARSIGKDYV
jgi:hypothetical protein